jgi:hypothetical protein
MGRGPGHELQGDYRDVDVANDLDDDSEDVSRRQRAHERVAGSDGSGAWRVLLLVLAAGCAMGAASPNPKLQGWAAWAQAATGWSYTLAWSLSFYPQVRNRDCPCDSRLLEPSRLLGIGFEATEREFHAWRQLMHA